MGRKAGDKIRAGDEDQAAGAQSAHRVLKSRARPNGDVDLVLDEINQSVGGENLNSHQRVARHEAGHDTGESRDGSKEAFQIDIGQQLR